MTTTPTTKPAAPANPSAPEATKAAEPTTKPAAPAKPARHSDYVIERPGAKGELPSYFTASGAGGWTWDKDKATKFPDKASAKPFLAKKREVDGVTTPAGAASREGAQIVKFEPGSDDEA